MPWTSSLHLTDGKLSKSSSFSILNPNHTFISKTATKSSWSNTLKKVHKATEK